MGELAPPAAAGTVALLFSLVESVIAQSPDVLLKDALMIIYRQFVGN